MWKVSDDTCPKCKQPTEVYITTDADGEEYEEKERCKQCGWIIEF